MTVRYFNTSQLARRVDRARETVALRIASGELIPDGYVGEHPIFLESRVEQIIAILNQQPATTDSGIPQFVA